VVSIKKETAAEVPVAVPDVVMADLVVVRTVPNPRLVIARLEGGAEVRCRVRSNAAFRRGHLMPACRQVEETLWSFEGRQPILPRRIP
jgi:hypothetical protein